MIPDITTPGSSGRKFRGLCFSQADPDACVVNGSPFHAPVKALCLRIACHQGDQCIRSLFPALFSDRIQKTLCRFIVPFTFKDTDPVQISAAAGSVAPAADQTGIRPADHPVTFQCNKGNGRIEPGILKTLLRFFCICFVRLPEIGVRLLSPEFPLKCNDLFNIRFF